MHIESIAQEINWRGLDGVEMVVLAGGTVGGRKVIIDVYIRGTDNPTITIEPDTSNYKDLSQDEWIAATQSWVEVQGYREQWYEELARYNYVVSQVDLGIPGQADEGKSVSGRGLNYRFSMGWLHEAYIDVYVWVGYYPLKTTLSTIIYIELVDVNGREEHNHILIENEVYDEDILPLTRETLMPIVSSAVGRFIDRVRGLLGEPLIPLQPIKEGE